MTRSESDSPSSGSGWPPALPPMPPRIPPLPAGGQQTSRRTAAVQPAAVRRCMLCGAALDGARSTCRLCGAPFGYVANAADDTASTWLPASAPAEGVWMQRTARAPRFQWAGLTLSPLWGFSHRVWWYFICVLAPFVAATALGPRLRPMLVTAGIFIYVGLALVLALAGSAIARRCGRFASPEDWIAAERAWSVWGLAAAIAAVCTLAGLALSALVLS